MKLHILLPLALLIVPSLSQSQQRLPDARPHGTTLTASNDAPVREDADVAIPVSPAAAGDADEAAQMPAAGAEVGPNYVIGAGDTIQVFVWRNPELTITVPVRPDGKISTPLVEDIMAEGKTPSDLARGIEKVLAEYIRSPQVNVIVTAPRSVSSQITVIGQVGQPKSVGYRAGIKVLDVVLEVGGLGDFAAGNRAYILRTTDGKEQKIPVRLKDLMNKGNMKYNLPMFAGDVLVVPQSRI